MHVLSVPLCVHAAPALPNFVDDDMQVEPEFLAAHLRAHREQERCVVFGYIKPDEKIASMPLFERFALGAGKVERQREQQPLRRRVTTLERAHEPLEQHALVG